MYRVCIYVFLYLTIAIQTPPLPTCPFAEAVLRQLGDFICVHNWSVHGVPGAPGVFIYGYFLNSFFRLGQTRAPKTTVGNTSRGEAVYTQGPNTTIGTQRNVVC
jgi:hypothetical protein